MTNDIEAAELSAQTIVFYAAGSILSNGRPLDKATVNILRSTMLKERTPSDLVDAVCDSCFSGLTPEQVPLNPELTKRQAALFAAAVVLFAVRSAPHGDPLDIAYRCSAPYGVTKEFIAAFARELALYPEARRSTDTAASLRMFLEPPDILVEVLRRYQRGGNNGPERCGIGLMSPVRIQHPRDREATEALEATAGLKDLVRFLMSHSFEKLERVTNVAAKVRVGPDQFPGLYEIYRGCVKRAGVYPEPELYLENGGINAYTYGAERPYVVLHTGSITLLSTRELEFIIGHELGHIRFQHVLYLTLGRVLPLVATQLPFGEVIAKAIDLALFTWERSAEFSADRLGLLVCQDPEAALRVMVKLSGVPAALYRSVNVDAFIAQYEDYKALDQDFTGTLAKLIRTAYQTHPWTVVRAYELKRWITNGDYDRIVGKGAPKLSGSKAGRDSVELTSDLSQSVILPFECPVCSSVVAPDATRCVECGGPVTDRDRFRRCMRCGASGKPSLRFCESCGAPLRDTNQTTKG